MGYKIAFITEYLEPQKNGMAIRYSNLIKYFKEDKDFSIVDVYGPAGHDVDYDMFTVKNIFYEENYLAVPKLKQFSKIFSGYYDFIYFVLPAGISYFYTAPLMKASGLKTRIFSSNHVNAREYVNKYFKNSILNKVMHTYSSFQYKVQNIFSDLIISPSLTDEVKDYIEPKNLLLNANGYDDNIFKYHKKEGTNNKLLYFGRLAVEKNIDRTIDLFNVLGEEYTLDIIGNGPEMSRLKYENRTNNRIKFLGKKEHKDIFEHMKRCDISITSSMTETFCMTMLESAATGTPILYPKCSVFDSVYYKALPEGQFDVNNESSFVRAVNNIYNDYDNISVRSHAFAEKMKWKNIYVDLKEKIINTLYN